MDGNELSRSDTIYGITGITWSPDEKYVLSYRSPQILYVLDLETMDTTHIPVMSGKATGASWTKRGTSIVWTSNNEVFETYLESQITDTIHKIACNNIFFHEVHLVPDERFAFFRANIKTLLELPNLYNDNQIYWIDLQTGEIREVLMD